MSISVSRVDRVLVATLDRPEKRNALDSAMVDSLTSAVALAAGDPGVVAVVLRGAGSHFCAGADISEYHGASAEQLRSFTMRARHLCDTLRTSSIPVMSAVQGVSLGGGMELCLASDFVVASADASFGLPELRLGLIPGWGGTQRLRGLVGGQLASHLVLTSGRVDAQSALSAGLVAQVAAMDQFDAVVDEHIRILSSQSRGALVAAKSALSAAGSEGGAALETALLMQRFDHPDGREGIDAFMARRPALFSDGRDTEETP